jgi:hypothetical protein
MYLSYLTTELVEGCPVPQEDDDKAATKEEMPNPPNDQKVHIRVETGKKSLQV